ncbi:MAG: translation elongation factor Ts [Acidimicrobiia bacterium]
MSIDAKDVAALRKSTGAGMMDCKKALTETNGDMDAAKNWLREKGLAGAAKRSDRDANNGAVNVAVANNVGVLVEITCETDFVAKGSDVQDLLPKVTALVAAGSDDGIADADLGGETVATTVSQLASRIGEKIELGRVLRYASADGIVDGYQHNQADRGLIGVLVELGGVDPSDVKAQEVAHDIALHIASAAPRYLTRDDVPEDVVANERSVYETLTRNEGKPEAALPKIVEGRLGGFFKEVVLLEQPFVRDPKVNIASLISGLGSGATIKRFVRVRAGGE